MTGERLTPEERARRMTQEWGVFITADMIAAAIRSALAEGLAEAEALKAENTRLRADVEMQRTAIADLNIACDGWQTRAERAEAANTPLRDALRDAVGPMLRLRGLLRRLVDELSGDGDEPRRMRPAIAALVAEANAALPEKQSDPAPAVTGTTSDSAPFRKPAAPADPE